MCPIVQLDFGACTASDLLKRRSLWILTILASIEKQPPSTEVSAKRCGTASVRVSLVPSLKRNLAGISTTKHFGNLAPSVPQISGHGLWHRKPVTGFQPFRLNHDSA